MALVIEPAASPADVRSAEPLFDKPVQPQAAERFLADPHPPPAAGARGGRHGDPLRPAASRPRIPTRAPRCSCTNWRWPSGRAPAVWGGRWRSGAGRSRPRRAWLLWHVGADRRRQPGRAAGVCGGRRRPRGARRGAAGVDVRWLRMRGRSLTSRSVSPQRSTPVKLPPFQLLLERHSGEIHRFLVASLGPVEAEDAFQETFLSALPLLPEAARRLEPARLAVPDRPPKGAGYAPGAGESATAGGATAGARRRCGGRRSAEPGLWRAVRRLPDKQRTAVFLRFAADLDYAQIGAALDCSEPAARQNVRAGLANIRKGWTRV